MLQSVAVRNSIWELSHNDFGLSSVSAINCAKSAYNPATEGLHSPKLRSSKLSKTTGCTLQEWCQPRDCGERFSLVQVLAVELVVIPATTVDTLAGFQCHLQSLLAIHEYAELVDKALTLLENFDG